MKKKKKMTNAAWATKRLQCSHKQGISATTLPATASTTIAVYIFVSYLGCWTIAI